MTDSERKQLTHIKQQIERLQPHGILHPMLTIHITLDNRDMWLKVLNTVLEAKDENTDAKRSETDRRDEARDC